MSDRDQGPSRMRLAARFAAALLARLVIISFVSGLTGIWVLFEAQGAPWAVVAFAVVAIGAGVLVLKILSIPRTGGRGMSQNTAEGRFFRLDLRNMDRRDLFASALQFLILLAVASVLGISLYREIARTSEELAGVFPMVLVVMTFGPTASVALCVSLLLAAWAVFRRRSVDAESGRGNEPSSESKGANL